MEYSIGDFSRISRLGIKTLRYYHEIGLLEPSRIDRMNGYRYYDEALLDRVRMIMKLKSLDFSLEEIKGLLENRPNSDDLMRLIERKIIEVNNKLEEFTRIRENLEGILASEKNQALISSSSAIREVTYPRQYVATDRFQGRYEEISEHMERLLRQYGDQTNGVPFCLYYDNSSMTDQEADIEICLPVKIQGEAAELSCRWISGGRALSILHKGTYDNLSISYQLIVNALYEQGYQVISPSREIYLKGPGGFVPWEPSEYLTEIQFQLP